MHTKQTICIIFKIQYASKKYTLLNPIRATRFKEQKVWGWVFVHCALQSVLFEGDHPDTFGSNVPSQQWRVKGVVERGAETVTERGNRTAERTTWVTMIWSPGIETRGASTLYPPTMYKAWLLQWASSISGLKFSRSYTAVDVAFHSFGSEYSES